MDEQSLEIELETAPAPATPLWEEGLEDPSISLQTEGEEELLPQQTATDTHERDGKTVRCEETGEVLSEEGLNETGEEEGLPQVSDTPSQPGQPEVCETDWCSTA